MASECLHGTTRRLIGEPGTHHGAEYGGASWVRAPFWRPGVQSAAGVGAQSPTGPGADRGGAAAARPGAAALCGAAEALCIPTAGSDAGTPRPRTCAQSIHAHSAGISEMRPARKQDRMNGRLAQGQLVHKGSAQEVGTADLAALLLQNLLLRCLL